MARYKKLLILTDKMVAISYDRQILPGTFEHTLSEVIDSLDMSIFDDRYKNDHTGAPAYDFRILFKKEIPKWQNALFRQVA